MNKRKVICENVQEPAWEALSDFKISPAVDLWKISIASQRQFLDKLYPFLSPEELLRVKNYHRQIDKDRFTLGKGMLRLILSKYLDCTPEKIIFKNGINDKPFVDEGSKLQFNVSYSQNKILIAVSAEPVGLDIEYINPDFAYRPLLENCFMEDEISVILKASRPRQVFFQFWTRKEALLKASALGLGDYLKDFSCLDGTQEMPQQLGFSSDWRIKSFLMENDYQVSIAQHRLQTIRYCKNHLLPFKQTGTG